MIFIVPSGAVRAVRGVWRNATVVDRDWSSRQSIRADFSFRGPAVTSYRAGRASLCDFGSISAISACTLVKGAPMVIPNSSTELTSVWNVVSRLRRYLLTICVIVGGLLTLTHVARQSAHRDREFE